MWWYIYLNDQSDTIEDAQAKLEEGRARLRQMPTCIHGNGNERCDDCWPGYSKLPRYMS